MKLKVQIENPVNVTTHDSKEFNFIECAVEEMMVAHVRYHGKAPLMADVDLMIDAAQYAHSRLTDKG